MTLEASVTRRVLWRRVQQCADICPGIGIVPVALNAMMVIAGMILIGAVVRAQILLPSPVHVAAAQRNAAAAMWRSCQAPR